LQQPKHLAPLKPQDLTRRFARQPQATQILHHTGLQQLANIFHNIYYAIFSPRGAAADAQRSCGASLEVAAIARRAAVIGAPTGS
jgi:hypothetical protein